MGDTMKPKLMWTVRMICCGRDYGSQSFATWNEAEAFREAYISGPGVNDTKVEHASGHIRSGVISQGDPRRLPTQEELRREGWDTPAAEYWSAECEKLRGDVAVRDNSLEEGAEIVGELKRELATLRAKLSPQGHKDRAIAFVSKWMRGGGFMGGSDFDHMSVLRDEFSAVASAAREEEREAAASRAQNAIMGCCEGTAHMTNKVLAAIRSSGGGA